MAEANIITVYKSEISTDKIFDGTAAPVEGEVV